MSLSKYFSDNQRGLKELMGNWKWILAFTAGYRGWITLFALLGILASCISLATALISKGLIDAITTLDSNRLFSCILLMLGCGLLSAGINAISGRMAGKVQIRIQNKIHSHLFDFLLHSSWQDVLTFSSGDLINRFTSDVHTVGSCAFIWLPKFLIHCFTAGASLIVVALFDPFMALVFCCCIPVLVLSSRKYLQKMQEHNRQMRKISSELSSYESEVLRNFDTLKSFSAESLLTSGMDSRLSKLETATLDHNLFSIRTGLWINALSGLLQYFTFGYCLWRLWQGQLQWGTLVLFLQQHRVLSGAFSGLVSMIPTALSGSVSAERLRVLTQLEKEESGNKLSFTTCTLHAEGIQAGYKTKPDVLKDVSFDLRPGETIALTGPSGEGKTTLLRLLLALIPFSKGTLTAKTDKGNFFISPDTRSCFTYVPQGNTMMAASVADNLRLANPQATKEEMVAALKAACAWEFIEPIGLDSIVGEGGKGFSQGQSQRLSIARALLRNAPILLLDEATSDLDPETETRVLQNLSALGKSCILTTHRSTVSSQCDRIYRIEDGILHLIK